MATTPPNTPSMSANSSFFEWDPKTLSVGVDAMDLQHQQLIQLINRICAASEKPPQKDTNLKAFDALVGFALDHFRQEEDLMEREKYPTLKVHKIVHQNLVKRMQAYREELIAAQGKITPELLTFLKMWLTGHIMGIDMEYGKFMKGEKSTR
jgi:hemerythrin